MTLSFTKVTLASKSDAYNFRVGQPLKMLDNGSLVPMTRRERLVAWLRARWQRATRWWRPRTVVARVDPDKGSITVARERWSWRRWRWERDDAR